MPTDEEIMAARSAAGGWTRETLASWGVPWRPPGGWKVAITTEPSAPRRPDAGGADGQPWIRSPHGMALRAKCLRAWPTRACRATRQTPTTCTL